MTSEQKSLLKSEQQDKKLQHDNQQQQQQQQTTFKDLGVCEEICSVCEQLNYKSPTKIQRQSIPYSLKGRDVIGLAQTGSGKTAAFAIPVIQALLNQQSSSNKPFYCCVIAPNRQLSIQISDHFKALGKGIGLKTAVLVGGLDMMAQAFSLSKKPHIVVGTPGRMVDHLSNTKGFHLRQAKFLIFDEADRLLDQQFEPQVNQIIGACSCKDRITFLFSATMTSKVQKLQRASLKNPVKIQVTASKYTTVETLTQNYIFIPARYKDCYLVYLLSDSHFQGSKIIVFTSTCASTIKTTLMLRNLDFPAIAINGRMQEDKRLAALLKFKAGHRSILVCTDVASRGLDIPSVDLVLIFDIPSNPKDYIHRVGRTARAGKTGRSVCFVTQYDVQNFQRIEYLIEKKLAQYQTDQKAAVSLHQKVMEAGRFAANQIRALEKKSGKGRDQDSEETNMAQKMIGGSSLLKKRSGGGIYDGSFVRKKSKKKKLSK